MALGWRCHPWYAFPKYEKRTKNRKVYVIFARAKIPVSTIRPEVDREGSWHGHRSHALPKFNKFSKMTRILLLSDTHGHIDESILKYAKNADHIWHAGDIGSLEVSDALAAVKPLRAVYGNIDNHLIRKEFPLNQRFFCEGVDVWITHIGGYPGKYDPRIREEIRANPPKLFISGHSHILKVMWDKKLGVLHMNPGACGRIGLHQVRTMLQFAIEGEEIKNLEVIELGKR